MQRLLLVRALFLFVASIALFVAYVPLGLKLNYHPLIFTILVLSIINLLTWVRVLKTRSVSHNEFFGQLIIDVLGVTAMLYFSGGAESPFVSSYLVPISISAATLRWRFSLVLTFSALLAYSLLFFFYVPVAEVSPHHGHHQNHDSASLHTVGMWVNFSISAGLISFFVVRMAEALRKQSDQLSQYREEMARDGQLFSLAALAAGTAHELGTPLSTMKMLAREMQLDRSGDSAFQEDVETLNQQIDHCANILARLHQRAELRDGNLASIQSSGEYCRNMIENWMLLRPETEVKYSISDTESVPVSFPPAIEQAVVNIFNNAADASRDLVEIRCRWTSQYLSIVVLDDGPGIPEALQADLDKPYKSSKGEGRGLGLFLTQQTLTRYSGRLLFKARLPRGTETEITLPVGGVKYV